jgi:nitroreductase
MNVLEALYSRMSVRAFKPDRVSKETLEKILEAATRTPSWGNTQPWEIYVAAGETLEKLRQTYLSNYQKELPLSMEVPPALRWPPALKKRTEEATAGRMEILGIKREDKNARKIMSGQNYKFFGAPVIIYLCMDRTLTNWSLFDLGALSQSIMLTAQQFGVDSIPAALLVAYPDIIRSELGIPQELEIVFGIAIGFRDAQSPYCQFHSSRRPVQEVVRYRGI